MDGVGAGIYRFNCYEVRIGLKPLSGSVVIEKMRLAEADANCRNLAVREPTQPTEWYLEKHGFPKTVIPRDTRICFSQPSLTTRRHPCVTYMDLIHGSHSWTVVSLVAPMDVIHDSNVATVDVIHE